MTDRDESTATIPLDLGEAEANGNAERRPRRVSQVEAVDLAPAEIVRRVNFGRLDLPGGRFGCPVCTYDHHSATGISVHIRSHWYALDREVQLQIRGMEECPNAPECDYLGTQLRSHLSRCDHVPTAPRRGPGRPRKSEAVEEGGSAHLPAVAPRRARAEAGGMTPADAAMAIVEALAPDGTIPVGQLHRVTSWISEAEAIVEIARGER